MSFYICGEIESENRKFLCEFINSLQGKILTKISKSVKYVIYEQTDKESLIRMKSHKNAEHLTFLSEKEIKTIANEEEVSL